MESCRMFLVVKISVKFLFESVQCTSSVRSSYILLGVLWYKLERCFSIL